MQTQTQILDFQLFLKDAPDELVRAASFKPGRYKVTPSKPRFPGATSSRVWKLRERGRLSFDYYDVDVCAGADGGRRARCTCPDYALGGRICKHIGKAVVVAVVLAAYRGGR